MDANAMLALANDFDSGVDIDNRAKEQPETKQEVAPAEKEATEVESAGKEVENTAKSESKQEQKPPAEQKRDSKFAQEQQRKAKTWEQINAEHQRLAHGQALLDGATITVGTTTLLFRTG